MTKEERNKLIYARHEEGLSQRRIGELYGLSQSAVSKIVLAGRKGVFKQEEEHRGRKSKLNTKELEQLGKYMRENTALDYGFATGKWDKWSVQELIKKEFGVHYHENHIWQLMKKLGFSTQKPQRRDYRQDANQLAAFKQEQAAALKKKHSRE